MRLIAHLFPSVASALGWVLLAFSLLWLCFAGISMSSNASASLPAAILSLLMSATFGVPGVIILRALKDLRAHEALRVRLRELLLTGPEQTEEALADMLKVDLETLRSRLEEVLLDPSLDMVQHASSRTRRLWRFCPPGAVRVETCPSCGPYQPVLCFYPGEMLCCPRCNGTLSTTPSASPGRR